jgi:hypothetical protein
VCLGGGVWAVRAPSLKSSNEGNLSAIFGTIDVYISETRECNVKEVNAIGQLEIIQK